MSAPLILLTLALFAAPDGADDELRIEQLLRQVPVTPAAPAKKPPAKASKRAPVEVDPAAALVGHQVRVRTVDRGMYAGTLQAADAAGITLRIELPKQPLNYTLPRSGITELEDAEPRP
jgi:hypothetical protein